jgi:hypothetical protein
MTENQEEKITCPHCQHENDANATRCAKCGTELIKTISVPEIETGVTNRFPSGPPVDVAPDALTLLVSGFKSPITVHRKRELVIGRRVPDHPVPDVDLASYNAYKLGVSRRHAVLRCSEDGCAIEDQASANATWVNENKITPFVPYLLQSSDTLRLGHLVMQVYFTTIDSIYLFETAPDASLKLTPDYLLETLSPYLQALNGVQSLINATLDREALEVTIGSIRHDATDALQVTLRKATEAINVILRHVTPWKNQHSELAKQEDKTAFETELKQLAGLLIDKINPDMSEQDRPDYTQRLLALVRVLVLSPLTISESPPKRGKPVGH